MSTADDRFLPAHGAGFEHPLEGLLDEVSDGVLVLDDESCIAFVNRTAARLLRRAAGELAGVRIDAVLPEAAEPDFRASCERALRTSARVTFDRYHPSIDLRLAVAIVPSPSSSGLTILLRELTKRGLEQAGGASSARLPELAHAARLQHAVLESAAEGIYGLDAGGRANFVNASAARMLGYEAHELVGVRMHDLMHHTRPDGRALPAVECAIYSTLESGMVVRRSDELFWRKDGTSFPVEYTATPLRGGGRHEGAVVTFSDISERRRAEEELVRYAARLASLRTAAPRAAADVGADAGAETQPPAQIVARATALAREQLGMELAFVSEIFEGQEVVRTIEGDLDAFGLAAGSAAPLGQTYCQRVLAGELPNAIRDTRADPRVKDLAMTALLGVGAYIGVPLELPDGRVYGMLCCLSASPAPGLDERDVRFLQTFAGIVADQLAREELEARARRLEGDATTARALILALEARDHYTGSHSQGVVALARAVGGELGLTEDELATVEHVALLHDIGKVGVPDAILQKPEALDELDWLIMREHPAIGARIIAAVPALAHVASAVRAEHERWDGGGYPDGLAGDEIPLASRITLCCDAFHAMTSDRPYRQAMGLEAALAELRVNAGGQFDPQIVTALIRIVQSGGPAQRRDGQ